MATGIIPWAEGKNVTITMTPQDVSATGVLSDNALGAHTFVGRFRTASLNQNISMQNLATANMPGAHHVNFEDDWVIEIEELATKWKSVGAGAHWGKGNVLRSCFNASRIAKIVIVLADDSGTARMTDTLYGNFASIGSAISKPEVVDSATFVRVQPVNESTGAYIANPSLTINNT